jgi:hypothetical protein
LTGVRSTRNRNNLDVRVASATRRLGQVVADQLLRDRVAALKAKKMERQALFRRKLTMGDAVLLAGLTDWEPAEIVGALLDVKDRIGVSPTQRMGLRQRGQQLLPRPRTTKPRRDDIPISTSLPEA